MCNLSICIVTRDRLDLFKKLVNKINSYSWKNKVNWIIVDNSTDESIQAEKNKLLSNSLLGNFSFVTSDNLSSSRNLAVLMVLTKYFTFLDDDDYLSDDYYSVLSPYLQMDFDMLYTGVCKEGRESELSGVESRITDKLSELNSFDNYVEDRKNLIYLSGCGNIFNKSTWDKFNIEYFSNTCDDVYPVTKMYLFSDVVYKVMKPLYIYTVQNSVCAEKSHELKLQFNIDMVESYLRLIKESYSTQYGVILKAINNSISQLKFNKDLLTNSLSYLLELLSQRDII